MASGTDYFLANGELLEIVNDFDKDPSIGAALLAWLFEAAPFGLLVTGTDFRILYANEWFRRSLGGAEGPIIGPPAPPSDLRNQPFA